MAVTRTAQMAGFKVKPGWLEVFPNVKQPKSLYNAHRLPLQFCSYVLGHEFQIGHQDLETLIRAWHQAAKYQDLRLLHNAIENATLNPQSAKLKEWKQEGEELLQKGWTGDSQTNDIIGKLCKHFFVHEKMHWDEIEVELPSVLRHLPGYEEFCGHHHDLDQRVRDWARWYQNKGKHFQTGTQPKTPKQAKQAKSSLNEERQADARKRIEAAIAQIVQQDGQLPPTVRARQKCICQAAKCSAQTLRKYLPLWHPKHEAG